MMLGIERLIKLQKRIYILTENFADTSNSGAQIELFFKFIFKFILKTVVNLDAREWYCKIQQNKKVQSWFALNSMYV